MLPWKKFDSFGIAEFKSPPQIELFKPKLMTCHFTYPSYIYEVLNICRRIIFFSKIT